MLKELYLAFAFQCCFFGLVGAAQLLARLLRKQYITFVSLADHTSYDARAKCTVVYGLGMPSIFR